jgi:subfamily B ATP-binding cassette protein MsbA
MIWLGGRSILAGEMTLGDSRHVHLLHRPRGRSAGSIASIGTQITGGVRRSRSHPRNSRHDDGAGRGRVPRFSTSHQGRAWRSTTCWFEYNAGQPVLRGVSFEAQAGTTTGAGRSSGIGQEHAQSHRDGVNHPLRGPRARRRSRTGDAADRRVSGTASLRSCRRTFLYRRNDCGQRRLRAPGRANARRDQDGAAIAHCVEVISRFPEGYGTSRGRSADQAVRAAKRHAVSIARAILAKPTADPDSRRGDLEASTARASR